MYLSSSFCLDIISYFSLRLVTEGIMEQEANQSLLANHTDLMSRAFQEADSYSPSSTPIYSQVGEEQSKLLKVCYILCRKFFPFCYRLVFGATDSNWRCDFLGHWRRS